MRIVFFGTPYYVVPILEALHINFRETSIKSPIVAVVTQSPKPVGRKQMLEYSAVDSWAHKKNIPIFFNSEEIITNNVKADVGVLASYGALIPKEVIDCFHRGILVVHPSLLPQFRWGSPVPAAIVTNTNPTGVTVIKMDEKWDHGPILASLKEEITPDDTYESLRDRLFAKSSELLVQMIPPYLKGKIKLKPQDDTKASFARMITKDDAFIPPKYLKAALQGTTLKGIWKIPFIKMSDRKTFTTHYSPTTIHRLIRAMYPWPVAWTNIRIKNQDLRIKILKAGLQSETGNLLPESVQLEGKNPVSWEEFKRGYPNTMLI